MNNKEEIYNKSVNRLYPIILFSTLLVFLPTFDLLGLIKEYGKSLYFIIISILILITYSITILKKSIYRISINKIDILLFIGFIYVTTNCFIYNTSSSLRFGELLGLTILYILLRNLNFSDYKIVLTTMVISTMVQSIIGNFQLWGILESNHAFFKTTGSFFNPGPFAGYIITTFPIILGYLLFNKSLLFNKLSKYNQTFLFISGALILLAWIATDSRASYIGLAFSSSLIILKRYKVIEKFKSKTVIFRRVTILSSLISLLICGLILIKMKPDSAFGRLFIWNISSEIICENPLLGIGFDNYKSCYMNYQAEYFRNIPNIPDNIVASDTCYVFNEYLQAIIETGIIGFLLMLLILISIFKSKNKNRENELLIAKSGILCIGIFALFSYPSQILPIKINLICYLAWISNINKNIFTLDLSKKMYKSLIISPLLICIGILCLSRFLPYYAAYKKWTLSYIYYNGRDYNNCINLCKEIYPKLKNEGNFLTYYGKALTLNNDNKNAIKILNEATLYYPNTIVYMALGDSYKVLGNVKESERSYWQSWYMIPSKFYPMYKLALLYDETDQKEKAISMAESILSKKIKVSSIAIDEMKDQMREIILKYK